jgi:hypothetical protein
LRGSLASAMEIAAPILKHWIRSPPRFEGSIIPTRGACDERDAVGGIVHGGEWFKIKFVERRYLWFAAMCYRRPWIGFRGNHGKIGSDLFTAVATVTTRVCYFDKRRLCIAPNLNYSPQ